LEGSQTSLAPITRVDLAAPFRDCGLDSSPEIAFRAYISLPFHIEGPGQ